MLNQRPERSFRQKEPTVGPPCRGGLSPKGEPKGGRPLNGVTLPFDQLDFGHSLQRAAKVFPLNHSRLLGDGSKWLENQGLHRLWHLPATGCTFYIVYRFISLCNVLCTRFCTA